MPTLWQYQRIHDSDQIRVQHQLQQWNADKGGMDVVVAGEITASVDDWRILARDIAKFLSP